MVSTPLVRDGEGPSWVQAIERARRNDEAMRRALSDASADELLTGWLERVIPLDPDLIPPSLLERLPDYSSEELDERPFSPVYEPLHTPWLPLPPEQSPAPSDAPECPASVFDLMLPETEALVRGWLAAALADMVHIRTRIEAGDEPASIQRQRPPPRRPRSATRRRRRISAPTRRRHGPCHPRLRS